MEIKRNKDGTIKGVSTMGDALKDEPQSKEQLEEKKKREELKKKYDKKASK